MKKSVKSTKYEDLDSIRQGLDTTDLEINYT